MNHTGGYRRAAALLHLCGLLVSGAGEMSEMDSCKAGLVATQAHVFSVGKNGSAEEGSLRKRAPAPAKSDDEANIAEPIYHFWPTTSQSQVSLSRVA